MILILRRLINDLFLTFLSSLRCLRELRWHRIGSVLVISEGMRNLRSRQ